MCIVADKKFHKYLDINTYCMEQIKLIGEAIQGFKARLPLTQVTQYAKPCYNPRQMYQIYLAMLVGCNQANVDKAISGGKLFWEHMYRKYNSYEIAEVRALSEEKKQEIKESLTQKPNPLSTIIQIAKSDNLQTRTTRKKSEPEVRFIYERKEKAVCVSIRICI